MILLLRIGALVLPYDLTDEQKAATLANVPAGRLGQPDEIAAAVCYLASDAAAYVSGETLHVNGAMYMV